MKRSNWVLALCAVCGIILAGTTASGETYWELDGNATAGWLGTTNANPLTLKVNNTVGWRLLKSPGTPNVVGGYSGNTVSAIDGAAIGGGGYGTYPNRVTGAFGTVAGGVNNSAGDRAVVAGGTSNTASGIRSSIGGGYNNLASGRYATISGGGPSYLPLPALTNNKATDDYCVIGGGGGNSAGIADGDPTNGMGATVAGGLANMAADTYASVGGGLGNNAGKPSATIGGGTSNVVLGANGTVGGGRNNRVLGDFATIAGGGCDVNDGTGGWLTNNEATDNFCTIGGGFNNQAGAGNGNPATAPYATISGGAENLATGQSSAIGGGAANLATGNSSAIGGGLENMASAWFSTVGGGWKNEATGAFSTVGGGSAVLIPGGAVIPNSATDSYCTVSGGEANRAGDNDAGQDSGTWATVAGGILNVASGSCSAIPGGSSNIAAGSYSFAAGRGAQANASGVFAWSDSSSGTPLVVNDADRFAAKAAGGVYFYTKPDLSTGAYIAPNSGTWTNLSDRNMKQNITPVQAEEVLEKVARIPVATWRYKGEAEGIRHMGAMAQDVHAAFGLGDTDKGITTVDADGIALAAVQGLHKHSKEQDTLIAQQAAILKAQDERVQDLTEQIETLKQMVARLAEQ